MDKKIVLKEVITTISMTSNHKGVRDRVVMRRWVTWLQDGKVLEKGFVLKTASVKKEENKYLTKNFIEENSLSDANIKRYEEIFEETSRKLKEINSTWSSEAIDLKNRIRTFLANYYVVEDAEEWNEKGSKPDRDLKKCKQPNYAKISPIEIKDYDNNKKYQFIEKIDEVAFSELLEESELLIRLLNHPSAFNYR
ncbi:hypothetical protein [uncultured Cetobacterium sp.]|uniref:hypothetical protein n=1 Tax=uncultured Cetobacterium sp. TaxID=527638 RepID=UPI002626C254|nr:hypothetical protein [uncultured Cetobacterium sp.]